MRARNWHRDGGLQARMAFVYLLLAVLYAGFIAALWAAGVNIILIALISGGMLFFQYFFSDKLALSSMGAKEVSPEEAPDLHAMIGRLAQAMDLPMPKVAVMHTDMPNAFATGRSPKNAVVCVTTGIINRLDRAELEAVIGHELSHVKNRDVQVITFASFFATIAAFIVQWGFYLGPLLGGGGGRDRDDRRSSGAGILLVMLASVVTWAVSFLLIRALSRYRELAADRGSAVVTGAPAHLISALQKISTGMARIPEQDLRQVGTMNAFFIVPASVGELFSTHPSLQRRVDNLMKIQRQLEGVA